MSGRISASLIGNGSVSLKDGIDHPREVGPGGCFGIGFWRVEWLDRKRGRLLHEHAKDAAGMALTSYGDDLSGLTRDQCHNLPSPCVERLAFFGIVGMAVIDAGDPRLDVIEDFGDDKTRDTHTRHMRSCCPAKIMQHKRNPSDFPHPAERLVHVYNRLSCVSWAREDPLPISRGDFEGL